MVHSSIPPWAKKKKPWMQLTAVFRALMTSGENKLVIKNTF